MTNKKIILKIFSELTACYSGKGPEKAAADYILRFLKGVKLRASRDKYGNVLAVWPGKGKPVLLSARLDEGGSEEEKKPVISGDIIKSGGNAILGAESKGAVTAILAALKSLKERKKINSLELVFTASDKKESVPARGLPFGRIKAKRGLIIGLVAPLGRVVTAAPHVYRMDIRVKGHAARAGFEPEKGINAVAIAARAISGLKSGRIDRNTSCNIGLLRGGSAADMVPEEAVVEAEARSHDLKEAQARVDLFNRAFKKQVRRQKAKLYFKATLAGAAYRHDPRDEFIRQIVRANRQAGIKSVLGASGASGDASIFNGKGIKTVVISGGGANGGTAREILRISEIAKLADFLTIFLSGENV